MPTLPDCVGVRNGKWLTSQKINGKLKYTLSYSKWYGMKSRCKVGGSYQERFPAYRGCHVQDDIKDFQDFVQWHRSMIGYGENNYELDKDLLVPQNKVYGKEFCVLVPRALNLFTSNKNVGVYPSGVVWEEDRQMFSANLHGSLRGSRRIGYFTSPEQASKAYKEEKHKEAKVWVNRLKSGEFKVDERLISAMENWKVDLYGGTK